MMPILMKSKSIQCSKSNKSSWAGDIIASDCQRRILQADDYKVLLAFELYGLDINDMWFQHSTFHMDILHKQYEAMSYGHRNNAI